MSRRRAQTVADDDMLPPDWWSADAAVREDPRADVPTLASRLRVARARLELDQAGIAAALGVSVDTYSGWERGRRWCDQADVALDVLETLACARSLRRREPRRLVPATKNWRRPRYVGVGQVRLPHALRAAAIARFTDALAIALDARP